MTEEAMHTSTTSLIPAARWRAHAVSDGSQGADGVRDLARTAYQNLLSAEWEHDDGPATMPVHEYDRAEPTGQAYKAVYGYDADTRSERCAMGAACYTYRIPASALDSTASATSTGLYAPTSDTTIVAGKTYYERTGDGTDESPYSFIAVADPDVSGIGGYYEEIVYPGGVATIASIRAQIAVDRYCDRGACLYAVVSDDITPPSFGQIAALAQSGTGWYATRNQIGEDGQAPPPNQRSGAGGAAAYAWVPACAPGPYLHVILCLSDYLEVRRTWIEGGAMFTEERVSVAFSRPVSAGAADNVGAITNMTLGAIDFGESLTPSDALAYAPRVRLWTNWHMQASDSLVDALSDPGYESKAQNLLAFLFNSYGLYEGDTTILDDSGMELAAEGVAGVVTGSANAVKWCALCVHGMTGNKVFRGIHFSEPLNSGVAVTIPYRVLVYGIRNLYTLAATPRHATPVLWWGEATRLAFRRGELTSLRVVTDPASAHGKNLTETENASGATAEIDVTPLAAVDIAAETASIPFDTPWRSGEISSVIVALVPNGPGQAVASTETYDATIERNVSVAPQNAGVCAVMRTDLSRSVQIEPRDSGQYQLLLDLHPLYFRLYTEAAIPDSSGTHDSHGEWYEWSSHSRITKTIKDVPFTYGFKYKAALADGKTYTSPLITVSRNATFTVIPQNESRTYPYGSQTAKMTISMPATSIVVPFLAEDGEQVNLAVTIPAYNLSEKTLYASGMFEDGGDQYVYWNLLNAKLDAAYSFGSSYSWADTSAGVLSAPVTVSGRVTFNDGSRTYSSQLPATARNLPISVTAKTLEAEAAGIDMTQRADVACTIPEETVELDFSAPDGAHRRATVTIPALLAASSGGAFRLSARAIYAGATQQLYAQPLVNHEQDAVGVSETCAEQAVDLGIVSLYE